LSSSEQQSGAQDVPSNFVPEKAVKLRWPQYLVELRRRRRLVLWITVIGTLLAVAVAYLRPKAYTSIATLMPPDQQTVSASSLLAPLNGTTALAAYTGGFGSTRTPGSTAIGILSSRTVADDIIQKFELMKVYRVKLTDNARKTLADRTTFEEDKRSGLISITVMDHDATRARDIAQAYVEELNDLLNTLSASSARRERMFLESRLKSLKADLDASSEQFSKFSSRNATVNPQGQGQALFESATKLQAELAEAQATLSGLQAQYSEGNVRVREARARIGELQAQIRKMGQPSETNSGNELSKGDIYPSMRDLPILGVTFADLQRRLALESSLYETLTKQYELAKVQEAKEIPAVKELDVPVTAEAKSGPPRKLIILGGLVFSWIIAVLYVIIRRYFDFAGDDHPAKIGLRTLRGTEGA
jgi:uncharacterized protein involved in exopolysaccharide biosynthesis